MRTRPLRRPGPRQGRRLACAAACAALLWACTSSGGGGSASPPADPGPTADRGPASADPGARADRGAAKGVDPGSSPFDPGPAPDTAGQPFEIGDPFVKLARMPGTGFVEITEVRARDDGTVYFCSGVQGMNVVDATDPSKLQVVRQLVSAAGSSQYPRCQHVAWDDTRVAYVNRGDEIQPVPFIAVFDATGSWKEIASYTEPGRIFEGLDFAADRLYAGMHEDGLGVFEVRNGEKRIVKKHTVPGFTNAWGVDATPTHVYVADGSGGFAVVDLGLSPPAIVGRAEIGGSAQSVEVDLGTGVAYVAAGNQGLIILDVSDPSAPARIARADTPGTSLQVALGAGHAYVADWNDVRVFDVRNPSDPVLVATERIDMGGSFPRVLGAGASGRFAYLGEWTGLFAYELHPDRRAPDIALSRLSLTFNAAPNNLDAAALILENEGRLPLTISNIAAKPSGAFVSDTSSLTLQPGARAAVEITFKASSGGASFGRLELSTDDPDEALVKVQLTGNSPGQNVGNAAPDVRLALLEGGQWRLSDQGGEVVLLAYFSTF